MIRAEVIADSQWEDARLTTLRVRYPRIILAEVNTHRALSRNSASTRAISLDRQLAAAWLDPYIPQDWPETARGMAGGAPIADADAARAVWLEARDHAVIAARQLARLGVHRQHVGRLVEPWAWVDSIISATEWDNFFALRISEHSQPEIRDLALAIRVALAGSVPTQVERLTWHIPGIGVEHAHLGFVSRVYAAAGRLARVSYGRGQGVDVAADEALGRRLAASGHWSPFEHIAYAHEHTAPSNFRKWGQARHVIQGGHLSD